MFACWKVARQSVRAVVRHDALLTLDFHRSARSPRRLVPPFPPFPRGACPARFALARSVHCVLGRVQNVVARLGNLSTRLLTLLARESLHGGVQFPPCASVQFPAVRPIVVCRHRVSNSTPSPPGADVGATARMFALPKCQAATSNGYRRAVLGSPAIVLATTFPASPKTVVN